MGLQDVRSFVYNPNGSGEVWCLEGNRRRRVLADELYVWITFGGTIGTIPLAWFSSYPI